MAVASAHNGGRTQVNLCGVNVGGDYPLINLFKSASTWTLISGTNPAAVPPSTLDDDGYPHTIVGGGVNARFFIPRQIDLSGYYKCAWDGNGTIYCPAASSLASGSKVSTLGSGFFTFIPMTNIIDLGISAVGSPKITNLRFFHVDDETGIETEVFGSRFKNVLGVEGRFGILRELDWSTINLNQETTWWTRRAESYAYYGGTELRNSIYAQGAANIYGAVAAVGSLYSVDAPEICSVTASAWDGVLRDKTTVTVLFDTSANASVSAAVSSGANTVLTIATTGANANFDEVGESVVISGVTGAWAGMNGTRTVVAASAGSVTIDFDSSALTPGGMTGTVLVYHLRLQLDVGGTGAKNILNQYCNPLTLGGNSYPIGRTYQSLATLVYDEGLDAWIKMGGDAAQGQRGLMNGVPPELFVRLCAEVGAHPHMLIPHLALDPMSDYADEAMSVCKGYQDTTTPWMIPCFEPSNEVWNPADQYNHTNYANRVQAVLNGSTSVDGILSTQSYAVSAFTYPSPTGGAGTSDITFSTSHTFNVGSRILPAALGGLNGVPSSSGCYVTALNVGGNPNKITVNFVPSSGTYTSGGTCTPHVTDFDNWYGEAASKLGQVADLKWAGDRSKYHVYCAVQTAPGITSGGANAQDPRMTSPSFVIRGNPQSPFTATPAKNHVTCVLIANYITPAIYNTVTESDLAGDYAGATFTGAISGTTLTTSSSQGTIAAGQTIQGIGGSGAAVLPGTQIINGSGTSWTVNKSQTVAAMRMVAGVDLTAPVAYADTLDSGTDEYTLDYLKVCYENWKNWSYTRHGIATMRGYEGGYSPNLLNGGNSNNDRMRVASKYAPKLLEYTRRNIVNFEDVTDENFTADFFSHYMFSGNPFINGYPTLVWTLLQDLYHSPRPPEFEAHRLFNNRKRRLTIRT